MRLELDPDADLSSLRSATDMSLSIGRDVWRLRWRRQLTTVVAADADLHTTCGALLDVLALLETELDRAALQEADPTLELASVNVLVDRALPSEIPSETDQALRSLRDATRGVNARLWYPRDEHGWTEDTASAPAWRADDPRITRWVDHLLLPRLTTAPGAFVLSLVRAVDDPSLHLYPSELKAGSTDDWALRIDGLQIGTANARRATLTFGKPGKSGDGPQRRTFTEVFGQPKVTVSDADRPPAGELTIAEAAEGIRALLRRFREADVRGAPLTHRTRGGTRIIDEHTLEARLLNGLTRLQSNLDPDLILDDRVVARGSQFPTLWGHGAKPRYLDAMLRQHRTPLAIELKVATGGQGRYYRRSLVQAVLYRHFIQHAPGLDPWFREARIDRAATKASVGVPLPTRWTARFEQDLNLLKRVASRVGADVWVLDDRATPDWVAQEGLPEPQHHQYEQLSWSLAAALASRWPRSLGRIVELHDAGGFYDQIQLQSVHDRTLETPSPQPRVTLSRPGSLWVFGQTGEPRWTWREIWNHLAQGGDPEEAATIVGAIAGLGPDGTNSPPVFAQLACAFLEATAQPLWSWRCAWSTSDAPWIERYRAPLRRYSRQPVGNRLPAIPRIWGAVRDDEAAVIVDQENLRTWAWVHDTHQELTDENPIQRMRRAASLVLE